MLLGDSHLAKMTKPLVTALEAQLQGTTVYNCAMGGADRTDILSRAPLLASIPWDGVVVSVGTNDLAPWKQVPVAEFDANLRATLQLFRADRVIVLGPPPVDEDAQPGPHRRMNDLVRRYSTAAKQVADDSGATDLDTGVLLQNLTEAGPPIHAHGGVHLSPASYDVLIAGLARALDTGPPPCGSPSPA